MIAYRDFVPRQLREPRLTFNLSAAAGDYEDFDAAVAAADAWLRENPVKLLHLETVVLPNIWSRWEEGSRDAALHAGEAPSWHQFLRVWYESA